MFFGINSMSNVKYCVLDHHSMWGWAKQNSSIEHADIVFTWNDFTMEANVQRWQKEGKKVICFEHGWNAFFDYKLNNHTPIADGFLALGKKSYRMWLKSREGAYSWKSKFGKNKEKKRNKATFLFS